LSIPLFIDHDLLICLFLFDQSLKTKNNVSYVIYILMKSKRMDGDFDAKKSYIENDINFIKLSNPVGN